MFGWEHNAFDYGAGAPTWLLRLPGYGAFLAERDPEGYCNTEAAPDGFADAVAWMHSTNDDAYLDVTFSVRKARCSV